MTYAAITTDWYKQREAAEKAGAAKIQFLTFALGDGNGNVPALPVNGLVHQVYAGNVTSVAVSPYNANQLDITITLPDVDALGNVVGPFFVREAVIFDENGKVLVAATTNFEKTTSSGGQTSSFLYVISVILGDATAVTIFNNGPYATSDDVTAIEANMADLLAGLARAQTELSVQRMAQYVAAQQSAASSGALAWLRAKFHI